MTTTYTVTNIMVADETALAAEVNTNFTDVLTALNAFDAGNLASGTVPLARITGLTTTQLAAAAFKDEDDMASDSATAMASQQSIKAHVAAQIAANKGIAKAWAVIDGTGTPSITTSLNATSVADNGTGDYTITWSITMSNTDYGVFIEANNKQTAILARTTTTTRVGTYSGGGSSSDSDVVCVKIFGDLA